MSTGPENNDEKQPEGIFDNYRENQQELLQIYLKKTRDRLLIVAAIFFGGDILGLLIMGALTFQLVLWSLLVPAIMVGLALLAMREPMTAAILAFLVTLGVWIYIITLTGAMGAISGWLLKIIIIVQLIVAIQSARDAQKLKRELIG